MSEFPTREPVLAVRHQFWAGASDGMAMAWSELPAPRLLGWNEQSSSAFENLISLAIAASPDTVSVGLLAICVDYFDIIVASHGHEVGQEVIRTVGQRIRHIVNPGDTIVQCSDDGYALLCAPADARAMAKRIAAQFHEPVMTEAGQLAITTSVGVTSTTGQSATDARMLLRQARSAVAGAQRDGRGQLAVYDEAIRQQVLESYKLEQQLRSALDNHEMTVSYQPVVSLQDGDVVGVEALARWDHDTFGDVCPHTFIPIAEESGLIYQLGRTVLAKAMHQAHLWHKNHTDLNLSVNLSNRQLLDPDLVPMMERLLTETNLNPRSLNLEISESVVMSDVAASMTILGHLKDLGFGLAIDDFGTGYSSLNYLHRLPVDVLKIDQSFVQGIYSRDDRVIAKAIIDLAHTLGMKTVALGVETHLQAEVLHALNCDMAQGFYLHPPTAAVEVDFAPIDFEKTGFSENLGSPSGHRATTAAFARR